jgi:hypothetical protein
MSIRYGLAAPLLTTGLLAITASAAELKPATIAAWDEYVQAANARMRDRLQPGRAFLWIDEVPDRERQVRAGEIVVVPADGQMPKRLQGGLISDCIGAAFVPGVTLDDLARVLRDYRRYTEYYGPHLREATLIRETPAADEYSLLLVNKSMLSKTAFSGEYETSYFQVDARRRYSIVRTLNMQEIEDVDQPGQRKMPAGEGHGYLWRVHAITRLEQRDGGVFIETEAIGLSRDFPALTHWMVDSVARRVSKNALMTSLEQTRAAVAKARVPFVTQTPAARQVSRTR